MKPIILFLILILNISCKIITIIKTKNIITKVGKTKSKVVDTGYVKSTDSISELDNSEFICKDGIKHS